ncbi:MAG: CRISPR-associated endonuclease Cas2 [Desulfurobacteriaceae bacterium]
MNLPKRISRFVVIYDICVINDSYQEHRSSAKRRAKVMRILYDYGIRTQLSVFEVELQSDQYEELIERIENVIRMESDKVYIYPLDNKSLKKIKRLGKEKGILKDFFF